MPTVPAAQRQVALQEYPGATLTAAETPESQGAGIADAQGQIAQALTGAGAHAAALGEEMYGHVVRERKRADMVAVTDGQTKLGEWKLQRVFDPNTGALTIKGKDAMDLPEKIRDEFNQQADAIEAGLATPEQKRAFHKIRAEEGLTLDHTIASHVLAESQQYQAQVLQATVENSRNLALANATTPREVGRQIDRQVAAITANAASLHLSPEETARQVDAARSATHVGVIETMLAQEQTKAAQVYFDEAKPQINGDQMGRIEKALREGSVRKEGQTRADEIINAGGTLSEQLKKADAIDDPEVRDQATQRIEHRMGVKLQEQRQDEENASKTAFNILDKTKGDLTKIPPTTWESFSGSTKASLRAYSDKLNAGEAIETDWTTFYKLIDQAGIKPDDFAKLNILNYRGKLADAQFTQMADLQLSIRNKDNKAGNELAQFGSEEQVVNDSLRQYGYPTEPSKQSDDQQRAVAELRRRVREQVGMLKKKDITQKDVQSIVDGILSQKADVKGSWWGLVPFNGVPFRDSTKRSIDLKISDVPQAYKDSITAALRALGKPVDDPTILNTYIGMKSAGK